MFYLLHHKILHPSHLPNLYGARVMHRTKNFNSSGYFGRVLTSRSGTSFPSSLITNFVVLAIVYYFMLCVLKSQPLIKMIVPHLGLLYVQGLMARPDTLSNPLHTSCFSKCLPPFSFIFIGWATFNTILNEYLSKPCTLFNHKVDNLGLPSSQSRNL